MSRSQQRGGEGGTSTSGPPPASSSRYHRSSIRSQKGPGLGSSSTRVQVVGERGYDSEIPRELGGLPSLAAGYHTEGQPSTTTTTKRASKELLRNVVDPRRNGRLSSMPSQHPHPHLRHDMPDDQLASSTRRVRRDKDRDSRRHRERDPVENQVPPSVWMNQIQATAADPKRARRTSGSRTRHEEPQQHDPRAFPLPPNQEHHRHPHYQSPPYPYPHHPRNGNPPPTHDFYRPNDPGPEYVPTTPQPTIRDTIQPPAAPFTTPAPAPLLPLPRTKEELLRSEGISQGSPFTGHRRHRSGRGEDFAAGSGAFADATNHTRPSLRHQTSRSEDLRKLGQGLPQLESEDHLAHQLARPVHVGRSASENVVPQVPQLATPGMYNAGLAVTPGTSKGLNMTPQLQESFAESANASRAPVNAAMASAAIANVSTDSDSARGERDKKRRTRRSKQVDAADLQALLPKDPTPPPVVQPPFRRQRTVSGRSITAQPTPPPPALPTEPERDPADDMVVYHRTPEPAMIDPARAPPLVVRPDAFRVAGDSLPQGLAIFASRPEMTSSGIAPLAGLRTEMTQVPGPRGDMTNEISRGAETLRAGEPVSSVPALLPAARRASILDEERSRKYSAAGTEGGVSAGGTGSQAVWGDRGAETSGGPSRRRAASPSSSSPAPAPTLVAQPRAQEHRSARDAMSMREAVSPMSNYQSIAPSVRSEVRDVRGAMIGSDVGYRDARSPDPGAMMGQSGSKGTATGYRAGLANVISPAIPKDRALPRAGQVPATPMTASKTFEPEIPTRPRVPSNNMLGSSPPDLLAQRATVDAHTPVPVVPVVDEEGRLRGPLGPTVGAGAGAASTMPARPTRMSFTAQRPAPQTATPVTSPPQTHAQAQPAAEASAVPKNVQQQTHGIDGSKESLVETLGSAKASKSKGWLRGWKSSNQKPPSPTPPPGPPPAPSASASSAQPRQRLLSGLMGSGASKHKQKPSESRPAQEKESRMQRVITSIRGGLGRKPSSSKLGHFSSKSMSRLPATVPAPPVGASLVRSASTNANGREGGVWPMSPRSKAPALPAEPPAPAPIPAPSVAPPANPSPTPTPAPVAPAITVPILAIPNSATPAAVVPAAPKPRPTEPEKRPVTKDVPIIDKSRVPILNGAPPAPTTAKARAYLDSNGRPIETPRAEKRSSAQPAPPSLSNPQRPNSPPLVNRPVGRIPVAQTKIFTNDAPNRSVAHPPTAPGAAPVPTTPHGSHRTLTAAGPGFLRRARGSQNPVYATDPAPPHGEAGDLGLPTPDETPRASPTGENTFEDRAVALKEEQRERERRPSQEDPNRRRHRSNNIVIPSKYPGGLNPHELTHRLQVDVDAYAHGGVLKFGHREKRAISVASVEAVSGQEGHFQSETSSIRSSTPGAHQLAFPHRDPAEATQSWAKHQTEEDERAGAGVGARVGRSGRDRRDGRKVSGVLKRDRGGVRKPGVAFDFPSGPIIETDEDPQDARQQADINLTYELERRHKRYK
ncbi:proteophosphoglycan 5 [Rhizoctonia solani]|uniref:Proteophosphoglycan 5 n=1 Tax=Rhizoctonia solani TaxID=456999 RepID=A0A8H8T254_9AGAM|nr:proteophosphoglycan 5 [Rhizoctonia solani]QRW27161.1 proteophosphoglycan 5 [Rhizoctonia solani]